MSSQKICTIKDLAKATGLAVSTVSRALKPEASCHPDTRKKVLAAARKMHYRPNFSARSLVSRKTRAIGLVLHTFENQILKKLILDLGRLLAEKGYDLQILFNPSTEESAKRLIDTIFSRGLDGIFYHSPVFNGRQPVLDRLLERGLPCVALDLYAYQPPLDRVARDFREAGFQITRHLLQTGRTRIAFVGTVPGDPRLEGYRAALEEAGQPPDESLIFLCEPEPAAAADIAPRIIKSGATALFANYDGMAALLLRALQKMHVHIPKDIALAGVGNEMYSDLLNPPLTTYDVYNEHLAGHLTELLFSRIEAPDAPVRTLLLQGRLIVRASSGRDDFAFPCEI